MSLKPMIWNNLCCPLGHTSGGQWESESTWILAKNQFLSVPSPGLETSVLATVYSYSCVWLDSDFRCRTVNSEDQLSAVVRQHTSITQVPGDALLALKYLCRNQPRFGKAQLLSPSGAVHFLLNFLLKYHILTGKSTHSKCPTQIFF